MLHIICLNELSLLKVFELGNYVKINKNQQNPV